MDLQVGGTSRFRIDKSATIRINAGTTTSIGPNASGLDVFSYGASTCFFGSGAVTVASLAFHENPASRGSRVELWHDAANVLAQRLSTNAQTFRIYNTTDAGLTNYERAKIACTSNVLQIGTEKLGTGAARALELQTDGTTRLTIGTDGNTSLNSGKVVIGRSSFAAYTGTQPRLELYGANIAGSDPDGGTLGLYGTGFAVDTGAALGLGCVYYGSVYALFARIRAVKKLDGQYDFSGGMVFETRDQSVGPGVLTEKMRISSLGLVSFGGTTSSFPAIKRNSAALNFRLADDSADCDITAAKATLSATLDLTIRTVTYGATMAIDAALGNKIAITLAGNGTISNPTNAVDGRVLVFRLRQDATGSRIPVWDTKYSFVGDLATVTLSTAANKIDRVAFEYDSTDDKWYCISFIKGS